MEPIAILVMVVLPIMTFFLGATVSEGREKMYHRATKKALRDVSLRERELAAWVHKNWPDEWNAYYMGHKDGYQQGVLQAAELEARAEEEDDDPPA